MAVFESGAILFYLARKTGRFLSDEFRQRTLTEQWLVWQVAGLGPMSGQAHHFVRYAPEGQTYGIERYTREVTRLVNVMEYRLEQAPFLAEEYSIADMACYPWMIGMKMLDIDLSEFASVSEWMERIGVRPAVARAAAALEDENRSAYTRKRANLTSEQWSSMFGDRLHAAARAR